MKKIFPKRFTRKQRKELRRRGYPRMVSIPWQDEPGPGGTYITMVQTSPIRKDVLRFGETYFKQLEEMSPFWEKYFAEEIRANEELAAILAEEILNEINREVLRDMFDDISVK